VSKTVTPQSIDMNGLGFSAVDRDGNVEAIPFDQVNHLRVLNGARAAAPAA
jgi:hypothetical protein